MNRQMLARATEGTAAPTPGYLYKDLAQSAASNPSACQEMANYLTNRLSTKQNPNIKFKCLKVIAKLCDEVPRNQFRRCISQNPRAVSAIKEAMNFRGQMDPVRGDEPNQRVRSTAKEALDAVYREASSSEMAAQSYGGGMGMTSSYGPSPHASPPPGVSNGPRRMEGIGNPRYQDPRLDPRYNNGGQPLSFGEVVREAGEVVIGMIKDPLARNVEVQPPSRGHSGNLPGYGNHYAGRPPPGAAELAHQTGGQWTMASNRGPAAIQNQEYYQARDTSYQWAQQHQTSGCSASRGGVGGSWGNPSASHTTPSITINSVGGPSGTAGNAASDGTYERNLILELCPPGGMKPIPPPDKLANFAKIVASLNPDLICPVLLDCLEDGQPWVIRAKALCVMETCIQSGGRSDGANPYRDFLYACQSEILPLAGHPRAAIKEPARRVLALLGVEGVADVESAPVAATAPNLLDFDDTSAPTPPSEAPPPPPPAAAPPAPLSASSSALFGGMQIKDVPSAQAPAAAPSSGNLLDFPIGDAAATPASNSRDIFRDTSAKEQPATPHSAVDMFGNMTLKENGHEDKKTDSEDAGDSMVPGAPTSGSAFGFINDEPSAALKESGSVHSAVAPHPSPQSFDPLMNLSPQTAQKKMMQMSPEQMQAMAYQQMMMQQRMQQMMMMNAMHHPQPGMPVVAPGMLMMPGMPPMGGTAPKMPSNFSFKAPPPAKKDDKKFDFVKDAMQTETKKN